MTAALGMSLGGLTALLTSRLAEWRTPSADARAGLWGYNASLAGAGLLSLYTPDSALYAYSPELSQLRNRATLVRERAKYDTAGQNIVGCAVYRHRVAGTTGSAWYFCGAPPDMRT